MNNLPNSIMLFIPAYQCEKQISRVVNSLGQKGICDLFAEIVVIENRSRLEFRMKNRVFSVLALEPSRSEAPFGASASKSG
ncbi:MAG: hypothetical protein LBR22_10770 [Desulfovibrio sp.]|jgi:hypothetical protein|nr:hypothetical protein [Desulfovibrio sp.]